MVKCGKRPWKDGYYFIKNNRSMILRVNGENCAGHRIVSFDFPDMESNFNGVWSSGNFGLASKEVEVASGKF